MHSKKEIIQIIFDRLKKLQKENSFCKKSDDDLISYINNYLNQDFIRKYHPPKQYKEQYEKFLINISIHQCNPYFHPLTCGVDSSHKLLVPKFDYQGIPYLICPTCGMVQTHIPNSNNKSYMELLKEIYDAANGDWDMWMEIRSADWADDVEKIMGE